MSTDLPGPADTRFDELVAPSGALFGWQPAFLGNALSCLANMFLLSSRCGVPAVYAFRPPIESLFAKPDVWLIDPDDRLSRAHLDRFLSHHAALFELDPAHAGGLFQGRSFDALGRRATRGEIAFTLSDPALADWQEGGADEHVASYCRRGNGLIVSGCYWRQYLDMRPLAADGMRLRRHLGPLRPDGRVGRRQRAALEREAGVLRIGVHFRISHDYSIWHGGAYHFRPEQTLSVIVRLHRELGDRRHTFYVFSDTPLDPSLFDGLPCHLEPARYQDDFIGLSSCDIVVGPPSTFATWAAFLAGGRRIVLTSQRIEEADASLLAMTVEVPFPTGHYLPGDVTGRCI